MYFAEDAENDLILDPEALGHTGNGCGYQDPQMPQVMPPSTRPYSLQTRNCDATEQVCLTAGVILHLFDLAQNVAGRDKSRLGKIIESGAARVPDWNG